MLGYKFPNGNSIGGPVIGRGSYVAEGLTNLDGETGQGLPALNWTYGAHAVEIEVDTGDRRHRESSRLVSAFDVGRVINDALCRAQVVGGGVQGIGTTLMEQYVYDGQGRLLNSSFTDYKIPTAKDIPREMVQIFVETPHDKGPFGARGVAEHPMISVPSAVSNALFDATGVRLRELPLTPERVFLALKAARDARGAAVIVWQGVGRSTDLRVWPRPESATSPQHGWLRLWLRGRATAGCASSAASESICEGRQCCFPRRR